MKFIITDNACEYLNFRSSLLSFNLFIKGMRINNKKIIEVTSSAFGDVKAIFN